MVELKLSGRITFKSVFLKLPVMETQELHCAVMRICLQSATHWLVGVSGVHAHSGEWVLLQPDLHPNLDTLLPAATFHCPEHHLRRVLLLCGEHWWDQHTHAKFSTQHSALRIQYLDSNTQHSTQYSTISSQHSELNSQYSVTPLCDPLTLLWDPGTLTLMCIPMTLWPHWDFTVWPFDLILWPFDPTVWLLDFTAWLFHPAVWPFDPCVCSVPWRPCRAELDVTECESLRPELWHLGALGSASNGWCADGVDESEIRGSLQTQERLAVGQGTAFSIHTATTYLVTGSTSPVSSWNLLLFLN